MDFVEDHGIELVHLGYTQVNNQWDPISEEVVLEALERALDTRNYPLLVVLIYRSCVTRDGIEAGRL